MKVNSIEALADTALRVADEFGHTKEYLTEQILVIAIKRTIREFRLGGRPISSRGMRELESVLKELKRTHSRPKQMSS